jgi:hypothetical protein
MKNKKVKQSIVDSKLKGRKLFWLGEESEVFLANSVQQLVDAFGVPDDVDTIESQSGQFKDVYKFMWMKGWCEDTQKGEYVHSWVHGDGDTVCQLSTSYN